VEMMLVKVKMKMRERETETEDRGALSCLDLGLDWRQHYCV